MIPQEFIIRLHNIAEEMLPNEAAVLLFGVVIGNRVIVQSLETVQNVSSNPRTSFRIDPEEEYRHLIEAEERGEALIAIYHSHPAPPRPSFKDLQFMRLNPVIWLIASKVSGDWTSRAYVLKNDEAQVVRVEIVERHDCEERTT